MTSRDLAAEIRVYLAEHGAATADEIALEVRARRSDVTDALAAGGFVRAQRPVGAHPHAVYWKAVPTRPTASHESRAALLYSVLKDGRPHSRREIFDRVGYMLTNNAASECRVRFGVEIECSRTGGEYVYRITGALPGVSGSTGEVDGSSAEPMTAQVREGSLRRPEAPGSALAERGGVEGDPSQGSWVPEPASLSASALGAAVSAAIVGNDDGAAAPSTPVPGQLSIDEAA